MTFLSKRHYGSPLLGTLLGELPSLVFIASAVTLSLSNATTPVTDLVH